MEGRTALCASWAILAAASAAASPGDEPARLVPRDAEQDARFGSALSVSGGLVAIGAPRDSALVEAGRAHLFRERDGAWTEEAQLAASDAAPSDGFGSAIATDGLRVVVGAPASSTSSGAAYVFVRTAHGWREEARLVPPDGAHGDAFGSAVALEGDTIVIGAQLRDSGALPDSGAVYAFERGASGWKLLSIIVASDPAAFDRFGAALALDAADLAVGAPGNDDLGGLAGAAYALERRGTGWIERAKLHASDASPLDRFATSIDVDRGRMVVGAPMAADAGAAYVFHVGPSGWNEAARLAPIHPRFTSAFGVSVSIDGPALAVGAPDFDAAAVDSGAAFLFHLTLGGWTPVEELHTLASDPGASFGWSVGLSGWTLAAGAPHADARFVDSGAAYVARVSLPPVGSSFCSGDGSATACPCSNEGAFGRGCANSAGAGARLTGLSSASVDADDLRFELVGLPDLQPALLFAGANAVNGGDGAAFGDGLRCAGGSLRRLGVRFADPGGRCDFGPGLAAEGGFVAGELARFQGWYRDPQGGPCGQGFNLSQGVELVFEP